MSRRRSSSVRSRPGWTYMRSQRVARYEDAPELYFVPHASSLDEYERRRQTVAQSRADCSRCSVSSSEGLF